MVICIATAIKLLPVFILFLGEQSWNVEEYKRQDIYYFICDINTFILNVMELLLSTEIDIIIYTDVVSLISILCLWWYMTKYLVEPINTVKKHRRGHVREFGDQYSWVRK